MSAGHHKFASVPPTDVQQALAWAAGSSLGELPVLAQHHITVLADEVRYLQAVEDSLLDETVLEEHRQLSPLLESGGGLQTWEKVLLAVVVAVVLLAGGALWWLTWLASAAERGAA